MSKISELSDGGSLVSSDYLIAVRSGGNVKVRMDQINVDQIDLGDNEFIRLGNSQDLTIVHAATQSIINQAGIGDLLIQKAGSTKLTVNSSGIDVTGTVTADGLTVSGSGAVGSFDRTDANAIIELKRSGSLQGYIGASTSGDVILYNASAAQKFRAADNGDISFYEDTGTTAKLFWDASAESLGIGTASPVVPLSVKGSQEQLTLSEGDLRGATFDYQSSTGALHISTNGANARTSPQFTLDLNGNVGIGVTPTAYANYNTLAQSGTSGATLEQRVGSTLTGSLAADSQVTLNAVTAIPLVFKTTNTERMRIDASGNVAIGGDINGNGVLTLNTPTDSSPQIVFSENNTGKWLIGHRHDGDHFRFYDLANSAERMRLDSSGNLLVGKTSAGSDTAGFQVLSTGKIAATVSGDETARFNRTTSDGDIVEFRKDDTTVGSIGTTGGDMYVGTGDCAIRFSDGGDQIRVCTNTGSNRDGAIDLGYTDSRFKDLHLSGTARVGNWLAFGGAFNYYVHSDNANYLRFGSNGSEVARFDNSGNLLVGTTSTGVSAGGSGTSGINLNANGGIELARSANPVLFVNRTTSDGDIVQFRQDGTTVGSIGTDSSVVYMMFYPSTGLRGGAANIVPATTAGAVSDNAKDWGSATVRWDDIYATNGTIQTSDRNEKQDIEALSDAEQRVAVAAKGLLRKFRWKSSVAENGDEARIHFGIIAQDLQAAFTAEGLDAGDYAMFINSTWTDEETGEEHSRMGVRYSELLAFIIAAI